jgi:2-methylcitrate dehydratase PrpD
LLAELLVRTRVRVSDDLTARYPAAWPSRVSVTLADGSCVRRGSDYPRGNAENPVDTDELRDKFLGLVEPRRGRTVARTALDTVDALAGCRDVARILDL